MAKSIKDYVRKVDALRGWYNGKRARDISDIVASINRNADVLVSMIELYEANKRDTEQILAELKSASYNQKTKEAADRL